MKKQLLYMLAIISAFTINAQVTLLKDINTANANANPANLITSNGKIYFSANNGTVGIELWITDGTESGTTLVKDIRPGTATTSSSPFNFFTFNDKFYFTANDGASELWTSDGTELGTTKVDIMPSITGEAPQRFVELNGLAYFTVGAQPGTGPETTNKLVQWNGADTSTSPAVRVANGRPGYESVLTDMVAFNNKLFLYMSYSTDSSTVGSELYAYDPATDTFELIKDITGDSTSAGISNFMVVGSELYFEVRLGELWKTDGTTVGTVAVTAAASVTGATSFFEWNGKLYFEGDAGSGDQLMVYDPVSDILSDISAIAGDHDPADFAALDGYLYYSGKIAEDTKTYLWRTDGTSTSRLDNTIFDIDDIAVLNGKLYFEGDDGVTGNELYTFDPATLSIEGVTTETIKVFPNPASDYIMVSKSLVNSPYSILDITGKTVKNGVITSEKINLNLSTGLYLFKVKTDLSTITKKIIIK